MENEETESGNGHGWRKLKYSRLLAKYIIVKQTKY